MPNQRYSKILWLIVVLTGLSLSCQTDSPSFYLFRENDFTIPAGLSPYETHFFLTYHIQNNFRKELEERQINPDQIRSVSPGRGSFSPIFQDIEYGLIRDVSIWLVSSSDPSVRKEIYYRDEVPLSQKNELQLLSGIANLKDFLLGQEKYNLEIQLKFRNFVPSNFENRLSYSFAIFLE